MKEKTTIPRVFILDKSKLVRELICFISNSNDDICIIGESESVADGLSEILREKPDVVLMDIVLNDGSGLDLIRQLRASLPEIVILILTMEDENIYAERVMESGANGYISKTCGGAAVLEALRRVMNGEVYLSPEFALRMVQKRFCHRKPVGLALDQLSTREFQVFQLLGRWQGTREIAGDLNLSIKTIEHYRETIKKKLGVANSTELVKLATSWSDNQRTTQSE